MPDISGLPALDVAIGLTFIFAILALIASGVNELIVRAIGLRADMLEKGIRNLLNDPNASGLAEQVLTHPLIATLGRHGAPADPTERKPASYIPAQAFTAALFDTIAPPPTGPSRDLVEVARDNIDQIPNPAVRDALRALADDTRGNIDDFRTAVEGWYDATMDRVSGWYKRRVQTFLIMIGIALAILFNADAFQIGNTLWNDDAVRSAVVTQAQQVAKDQPQTGTPSERIDAGATAVQDVKSLKLPLGWTDSDAPNANADPRQVPDDVPGWLAKLLGLLITGFAISLGAPFWFDIMGKALSLRSSGKPATTGGAT